MRAKPYSESCDMNKDPILEVLQRHANTEGTVLEVGSGTGQHAVYFAHQLPHLTWHPTDLPENLPGITLWLDEARLSNIETARALDVCQPPRDLVQTDYVYSANTVHIMSWDHVICFYQLVGKVLKAGGLFILYGPFSYHGKQTSESNARFDQWLKVRDPLSGVRDFDELNRLAQNNALQLLTDIEMPVNNRTLIWQKLP